MIEREARHRRAETASLESRLVERVRERDVRAFECL